MTICYGVENARSVRIEPPMEPLKPFFNRCFQASPSANTTYRLVAEGFDGKMVSESLSVKVGDAAVPSVRPTLIHTFAVSSEVATPGMPLVLCYSAPEARKVTIDPPIKELEPADRFCFTTRVTKTTTYTLTASGPGAKKEREQLTVTVK